MIPNQIKSLKPLLQVPRSWRKGSLESQKERQICPRLNALDAMSMDTLRGIVQTIKITKERKEGKSIQRMKMENLRRSWKDNIPRILTIEGSSIYIRFFMKFVFCLLSRK